MSKCSACLNAQGLVVLSRLLTLPMKKPQGVGRAIDNAFCSV